LKVLVTGVTGKTGRRVAESLVRRGVAVRAVVRDRERGRLATLGMSVELVLGDFDQPESIAAAALGCDGMYLVAADGEQQVEHEISAARAAVDSGVEHIVKLSSSDADQRRSFWAVAHYAIETAISQMDVGYSFIRPNYFMEGFLDLLKVDSNGDVTLQVPTGEGKIGAIDTYDIGECAAELLAGGNPLGTFALLTGPENVSMERVAGAFGAATGRSIRYLNVDASEYRTQLEIDGLAMAGDISDIYEEVRSGTAEIVSDDVRRITENAPRPIEQFAVANVDAIRRAISLFSFG